MTFLLTQTIRGLSAAAATAMLLAAVSCGAHAEDNKASREREALRRAQQSLRQTQEERDTLATEKASLTQAKDQLDSALKQTSSKVKGAESRAAASQARLQQIEAALKERDKLLAESQAREADLQAKLAQAQTVASQKAALVGSLTSLLQASKTEQTNLQAQNQSLYDTGLAMIDLYRSESPSAWLQKADAPLGLRGVRIENLAETFQTRLEAARYKTVDAATGK